ncbi:MAG: hypothetical protein HY658_14555 [Actinobacteria bacterium]|nr:hypothetical protein [Actinomycetota bacterium]
MGVAYGGSNPLPGGKESSLDAALAASDFPIYRPSGSVASDRSLSRVWLRTGATAEVYLEYESGIVVTVVPASDAQPTRAHAGAQIDDGVPGRIVEIGGIEAFLVPPSAEGDLGSVRMFVGAALVTVIGNGALPETTLIDVADSVVQSRTSMAV